MFRLYNAFYRITVQLTNPKICHSEISFSNFILRNCNKSRNYKGDTNNDDGNQNSNSHNSISNKYDGFPGMLVSQTTGEVLENAMLY